MNHWYKHAKQDDQFYKGLVEMESLKSNDIEGLRIIEIDADLTVTKDLPCKASKVKVDSKAIEQVIQQIKHEIKDGWFALFWNEDWMNFVFQKKNIRVPRNFTPQEIKPVIEESQKQEIPRGYIDHIREEIELW